MVELMLTCALGGVPSTSGTMCVIPEIPHIQFQSEQSCQDAIAHIVLRKDGLEWVCGHEWAIEKK
jgi:hypothetical protein